MNTRSMSSTRQRPIAVALILIVALCAAVALGAWQGATPALTDEAGESSTFVQSGGSAADIGPGVSASVHARAPGLPDVATRAF